MTTDELLLRMASVLQLNSKYGAWSARAVGCTLWGHGSTPREAMEAALKLWDDEL